MHNSTFCRSTSGECVGGRKTHSLLLTAALFPTRAAALLATFLSIAALETQAADPGQADTNSKDIPLEDLINIKVTSVSKKEIPIENSPAAVTVVTQDDIRRFGVTSIPDALRLVPGMDVAQINSHEWAVSARGFNGEFANKMLVLLDGRSIYTTGFGGVIWGMEDVVLEDLDRIEVIRGPGGTLWGANAFNGVINIISKSAKDTQGALVSTSLGTIDQPSTSVRYGGQLATNLFYRVYAKYFNRDGLVLSDGADAPDPWSGFQTGFRVDWEPTLQNTLTLQGDYFTHRVHENQFVPVLVPPFGQDSDALNYYSGANVLGRWTHQFSENSSLQLQAYYDYFNPQEMGVDYRSHTVDVDAQHRFSLGSRNDVVWGLGYRYVDSRLDPSTYLAFVPPAEHENVYSAFVQDDFTLLPERLKVTVGSKFEDNTFTGFEIQPSARVLWTPSAHQAFWGAISRAVRTPSISELDERVDVAVIPGTPPTQITLIGNPALKSEELLSYELGYRVELAKRASLDIAGFYNNYSRLVDTQTGTPQLIFTPPVHVLVPEQNQNLGHATGHGIEVAGHWDVTDSWRLTASYSWFDLDASPASAAWTGSPEQQFQVRSALNLPFNTEFNAALFYVDQIHPPYGLGSLTVQSYFRLDLGLVWHATKSLDLGIWGQNLLDDRHPEFTSFKTPLITEVPRGVLAKVVFRF